MRIYQKLLLGFLSISLLVVLIGVISVATNSQISADISQLIESSSKEVRGASGMIFALQAAQHRAHELLSEKYREVVEPGEADNARKAAKESRIAIEKAVSTFEKWLTFSRDATRSDIQLSEVAGESEDADEEKEELEILNQIEIAFIKYNNFLSYFISLTESDLNEADEWMTGMLEPSYYQTFLGVREYEEDAGGELVSESLEIIEATDNANQNLITVTAVALFAAVALGLIISHLISAPLVRLREAALLIGTGHLDTRVDIQIRDEVGDLARSFNKMAEDVQTTNHDLVVERRKVEITNLELKRMNQELDDFAYIASHDLKEPLRGIHNYAQFLIEDYSAVIDQDGRDKLETLKRLAKRMDSLISALLQFSHVGRDTLMLSSINMGTLAWSALDRLKIALEEADAEVKIAGDLPDFDCDPVLVGQVFQNLIANAIKYNRLEGSPIEVGWNGDMRFPIFHVRDNGIGIKEKDFESIFQIFKRLHGKTRYGGGLGAGLTIVKKIVERHGGRIWIESQPGKGSTFYFTLSEDV